MKGIGIVMKRRRMAGLRIILCLCFSLLVFASQAWAGAPPAVGGALPDFSLETPRDGGERSYLGLSFFNRSFKVQELKATQVVLIEIFSMYCPYCQGDAPHVNDLYRKIEAAPALKGRIKLIGIGAGNSSYEVGVFKKKYAVPFPLFPDKDFRIHQLVGEVRTPYFIGVKVNPDGTHRVFLSRLGVLGNVDQFLADVVKLSGIR